MIRDLKAEQDPVSGFPIVSWEEDRPLRNGGGAVRIACFIEPDPKSGALLFAAIGSDGKRLQGREWSLLRTFGVSSDQILYPPSTRAALEVLSLRTKSPIAPLLASGGQMMVAQFADGQPFVPMYLSLADASTAEMAALHDVLNREFRINRDAEGGYIDKCCVERFKWRRSEGALLPFTLPQLSRPSRSPIRVWELGIAIVISAAIIIAAMNGFWRY